MEPIFGKLLNRRMPNWNTVWQPEIDFFEQNSTKFSQTSALFRTAKSPEMYIVRICIVNGIRFPFFHRSQTHSYMVYLSWSKLRAIPYCLEQ